MVRISFFTCVFLVLLRLAIGWHFFFEGVSKVRQNEASPAGSPPAEVAKTPFTSAGYFAEAEGPIGPKIREWIGEPDKELLAKLTPVQSNDEKPYTKMPPALGDQWDDYAQHFEAFYKLGGDDAKTKDAIKQKVETAKTDYVLWLTDKLPEAKAKKKKVEDDPRKNWIVISAVGKPGIIYRPEGPMAERVRTYEEFYNTIRNDYEHEMPLLGKDVEKTRLRTQKSKLAEIRADLAKDVDEQTSAFKESLAKIVGGQLKGFDYGTPEDPQVDERVMKLLTLKDVPEGKSVDPNTPKDKLVEHMPTELDKQWNDYAAYVKEKGHPELREAPADAADRILNDAKARYVRYLSDQDQYQDVGHPLADKDITDRLKAYRKAVDALNKADAKQKKDPSPENKAAFAKAQKETVPLRDLFTADIRRHTDELRQALGGFAASKQKDFDNYSGTIHIERPKTRILWHDWDLPTKKQEWLDFSVRWGLLIAGGCVLVGLFTRLACLGCIGFLVVEFLSNSPFPWLPVSPKAEGSYAYINKNAIELLALLVLFTLPTGRWLGLDALLSRMWPFRRRRQPAPAVATASPASSRNGF